MFSIIVPVYNRAKTVARALSSLKAQIFSDFEVIIVDDGSTDESRKVIQPFLDDARFKYFYQSNSGKPSIPRNRGIERASNEWVTFLDSDDTWESDKLLCQAQTIREFPGATVVFCDNAKYQMDLPLYKSFFDEMKIQDTLNNITEERGNSGRIFNQEGMLTALCRSGFIMTQGVAVKKDAMMKAGLFDETIVYAEDTDMWLKLASDCTFAQSNGVLFNYYTNEESITAVKNAGFYEDTIKVLNNHLAKQVERKNRRLLAARSMRYRLESLSLTGQFYKVLFSVSFIKSAFVTPEILRVTARLIKKRFAKV